MNFFVSVENGDKPLFLDTVAITQEEEQVAEAQFDLYSAIMAFGREYEKAFAPHRETTFHHLFDVPYSAREFAETVRVTQAEDANATATMPESVSTMQLVKSEGAWRVKVGLERLVRVSKREERIGIYKSITRDINEIRETIRRLVKNGRGTEADEFIVGHEVTEWLRRMVEAQRAKAWGS